VISGGVVMAIYHLQMNPVRKAGSTVARSAHHGGHRLSHGATGRAAYLSAERLVDERGVVTDYTSKAAGVEHSELILPAGTEHIEREKLWRDVDAHPTRSPDAVVARDLIVALPHELSSGQRVEVAREMCQWIADRYQVAVDLGVHYPDIEAGSSEKNAHFHGLVAERRIEKDASLGSLQRDFNVIAARADGREVAVEEIRKAWERIGNDALDRAGFAERIDCRTLKAQGIDREATRHLGKSATDEMRGSKAPGLGAEISAFAIRWREADRQRDMKTPAEIRSGLVEMSRQLERKSREATKRIEEINAGRKVSIDAFVSANLGSLEAWQEDAGGTFVRVMGSIDRAERHRRVLREISQKQRLMRDATKSEATELTALGQLRHRSNKLLARAERIADELGELGPTERIEAGSGPMTKRKLDKIDRALKERGRDSEMEIAA
jgi:MobA/MobL family